MQTNDKDSGRPLVSLVTPVYNAMPWLRDYLDCVEKQTWRPMELILADDGSDDDSVSWIESRIPSLESSGLTVKLLKLAHHCQAAAVNAALQEVRGEYLTWCDADDIMLPECVEKKAQFLLDHPEIGMVRNDGVIVEMDAQGNRSQVLRSTEASDRRTQDIFRKLLRQETYCYAGCYMIRTSLLEECYPDRKIPVSTEGQNYQLLLAPAGRSLCGFVPEVLHRYMKRPTGHSSMKRSYMQQKARILNLSALFREILPHCGRDLSLCEQELSRKENEQLALLNKAALSRIREGMKKPR